MYVREQSRDPPLYERENHLTLAQALCATQHFFPLSTARRAPMASNSEPAASSENQDSDGYHVGSRVGRYTLVARLASGGMAHVWTAEPDMGSGLGRTVALKLIRPELAQEREYVRMFIDEATIASAIEHPNVCQIYDLEHHDKTLFMAMEWVPGDSLAGMLRLGNRFVPLDASIAARICADACAGLHAAHEALDEEGVPLGVIHRDVSPPNILISLQGQVKVSDFGVAKARRQLHERTKTGEVKGKFGYLAPEQITGAKSDRRIDVYAMGCVLYIATMGLRPFGNGPKAMTKILLGEYRKPLEVDSMFPPTLEKIIIKALQHKPDDRYATAEEMRVALEQWLVDARAVVTPSDIAQELVARMRPEVREQIEKLRTRRRTAPNIELLLDAVEENEPPTAASGIVVPPGDLRRRSESVHPHRWASRDDEHTVRNDVTPTLKSSGDEEDRSGWHKTSDHPEMTTVTEAGVPDHLLMLNFAVDPAEDASGQSVSQSRETIPAARRRAISPAPNAPETTSEHALHLIYAAVAGAALALFVWLLIH